MLVVVPMIWRRAVRLTEKRVLGEIPISYTELQAEKDMQRAEQAITQRRLEVSVDSQREQLTLNSIKIDRLKQNIEERDSTITNHLQSIANLEERLSKQKDDFLHQTGQLEQSRSSLAQAKDQIGDLELTKMELETQILHLETEQSEQKVELVAQFARIEALRGEISELSQSLKTETDEKKEALSKLNQKSSEFDRTKDRLEQQDDKLNSLQTKMADKDSDIATMQQRLKRMQETRAATSPDTNARLAETEARRVEAEAKISSLTLQLNSMEHAFGDDNPKEAVHKALEEDNIRLNKEIATLQSMLKELKKKYDDQLDQQEAKRVSPLSPAEQEVREEMKRIAAQVTVNAMEHETASSKLEEILNEGEKNNTQTPQAKSTIPDQDEAQTDPISKALSIAEHIANLTTTSHKETNKDEQA